MPDDLKLRIAKLKIEPGDVLVAKIIDRFLSPEMVSRIHHQLSKALPEGARTLVIDRGCELSVLTFDEIQRRLEKSEAA